VSKGEIVEERMREKERERETKEARDRAGRELGVALSLYLRSDKSVQSLWIYISYTVETSK